MDGINWINPNVTGIQFDGDTAFRNLGVLTPSYYLDGHIFDRLPDFAIASKLSPAAKIVYSDIFSWVFHKLPGGKFAIREYFFGYRKIAERTGLTRKTAYNAVAELIKKCFIAAEKASNSARLRDKLVPLNTVATSDATTEVPQQDASDDSNAGSHRADDTDDGWDDIEDCVEDGYTPVEIPVTSLKEVTTAPGKAMPIAVASKLRFTPMLVTVSTVAIKRKIRLIDSMLYCMMLKLCSPYLFASNVRIAKMLGCTRHTAAASLQRLIDVRMIGVSDHGYYVVANPVLEPDHDYFKKQFGYLLHLIEKGSEA